MHKAYEKFAKRTMLACGKHEELVQVTIISLIIIYGENRESSLYLYSYIDRFVGIIIKDNL